jgi:hypothetical protein
VTKNKKYLDDKKYPAERAWSLYNCPAPRQKINSDSQTVTKLGKDGNNKFPLTKRGHFITSLHRDKAQQTT